MIEEKRFLKADVLEMYSESHKTYVLNYRSFYYAILEDKFTVEEV